MKRITLIVLGLVFIILNLSLSSCAKEDDAIDTNQGNQNNQEDTHTPVLTESEIMSIIDHNTKAKASYIIKDYRYLLSCEITSTIEDKIPNASIEYGLEYGLVEPNSIFVVFNDFNNFTSKLAVSIIIPTYKDDAADKKYKEYTLLYNSYRALCNKIASGQQLSTNEKNLYTGAIKTFSETETYMKKYFKARTFVSVNGTRYYFSTIEIVNNQAVVKSVNCHTDEETTNTSTCDWCKGDGKCAATHCDNGLCSKCNGVGYTYTYVPAFGNMKEDCVFCTSGKCNSCHGSMRCSKCSGKGQITATTGGNAKILGEIVSIESTDSGQPDNGDQPADNTHEYVDLGLPSGIKWATCNIGADSPEDYGYYFAWGETTPKDEYTFDTYKWYDPLSENITKYCTTSSNGQVDNRKVLLKEDDAAYSNWGGNWRLPTKTEQDELRIRCTWNWTTLNEVNGFKIVGPNGNFIFLPAAGYIDGGKISEAGTEGRYWSNSLGMVGDGSAYYLMFFYKGANFASWGRYDGLSVRAVCQ